MPSVNHVLSAACQTASFHCLLVNNIWPEPVTPHTDGSIHRSQHTICSAKPPTCTLLCTIWNQRQDPGSGSSNQTPSPSPIRAKLHPGSLFESTTGRSLSLLITLSLAAHFLNGMANWVLGDCTLYVCTQRSSLPAHLAVLDPEQALSCITDALCSGVSRL